MQPGAETCGSTGVLLVPVPVPVVAVAVAVVVVIIVIIIIMTTVFFVVAVMAKNPKCKTTPVFGACFGTRLLVQEAVWLQAAMESCNHVMAVLKEKIAVWQILQETLMFGKSCCSARQALVKRYAGELSVPRNCRMPGSSHSALASRG